VEVVVVVGSIGMTEIPCYSKKKKVRLVIEEKRRRIYFSKKETFMATSSSKAEFFDISSIGTKKDSTCLI